MAFRGVLAPVQSEEGVDRRDCDGWGRGVKVGWMRSESALGEHLILHTEEDMATNSNVIWG